MKDFWNKFLTNRYWFVGTIISFFLFISFIWSLIDSKGFATKVNFWAKGMEALLMCLIAIFITLVAIYVFYKKYLTKKPSH